MSLALAFSQIWRARIDQGVDVLTNGLLALSAGALPERCQLQAELATALVSLEQFEPARLLYAEEMSAAEQLNDAHTLGLVLMTARTRAAAAALYPATLKLIETGQFHDMVTIGPNTPRLSAALAADAAGLIDEARGHFEAALHAAERLPHRLLRPTVQYWYGRLLGRDRRRRSAVARARAASAGGNRVPRSEDADPYRPRGTSARFAVASKRS